MEESRKSKILTDKYEIQLEVREQSVKINIFDKDSKDLIVQCKKKDKFYKVCLDNNSWRPLNQLKKDKGINSIPFPEFAEIIRLVKEQLKWVEFWRIELAS